MAMPIQAMGHAVEFAINGFVALDLARTFRPDVVLLDIDQWPAARRSQTTGAERRLRGSVHDAAGPGGS
jgi:CheY-like chemotaxis protein